jgi:multiple antibiotic resistance protein
MLSLFLVSLSAVFFVVDPFGMVPIFLAMTRGDPPEKIRSMCLRACLAAGSLLVFFALFGGLIFKIFGVSLSAFRVAGGILLLITALDMLKAQPSPTRTSASERAEGEAKEDIAIVPLAMPLLSGPGAIATVMVLMSRGSGGLVVAIPVVLSILITFVVTYYVLRSAGLVQRVLGQSGVAILERIMGLILAAIAVQFMADGGRELLAPR